MLRGAARLLAAALLANVAILILFLDVEVERGRLLPGGSPLRRALAAGGGRPPRAAAAIPAPRPPEGQQQLPAAGEAEGAGDDGGARDEGAEGDGGGGLPDEVPGDDRADGDAPPPPPPEEEPSPSPWPAPIDAAARGLQRGEPFPPLPPADVYTHQTCYVDGDESEMCVYEGAVCFDGRSVVVLTDRPTMAEPAVDSANECWDYRHYEPTVYEFSRGCRNAAAGARPFRVAEHPADPAADAPLVSRGRWWGPHNRHHLFFREVHAADVFGPDGAWGGLEVEDHPPPVLVAPPPPTAAEVAEAAAAAAAAAAYAGEGGDPPPSPSPSPFPPTPLRLRRRTRNPATNVTVEWLPDDAGLFLAATPGQSQYNPFHFFSSLVGPAYAAVRNNASGPPGTHPLDGYVHALPPGAVVGGAPTIHRRGAPARNRAAWRVGPQWALPPMTVLAAVGDGAREVPSAHHLLDWFASALALGVGGAPASARPPPAVFFNDLLSRLSPSRMLCARRGVLPSAKPRLFSTPADAWVYRARAYLHAGIDPAGDVMAHPRTPPRHITLIDRQGMHGRALWNRRTLLDALEASDVPYTVVDRMDGLSFKEQVALMARTGVLIGVHGAALANIAFLPARAAVVELFPPMMKKDTYRHLAGRLNLHHFAVYSRAAPATPPFAPGGPNVTGFFGQEVMGYPLFREECVATNVSSYDALVVAHCQWASKTLPVIVPRRAFAETLRDALDAIGAFSLLNPEWAAIAAERGLPPPDRIHALEGWDDTW